MREGQQPVPWDQVEPCWNCGAEAGRPVFGQGWKCTNCGQYQNWGPCICCGQTRFLTPELRAQLRNPQGSTLTPFRMAPPDATSAGSS